MNWKEDGMGWCEGWVGGWIEKGYTGTWDWMEMHNELLEEGLWVRFRMSCFTLLIYLILGTQI